MTLELTIIFPVILFLLLAVIFFTVLAYHKLAVMENAIYTTGQSAATWSNSRKDLEAGFSSEKCNDGLYWRIFDDFAGSLLVHTKLGRAEKFAYTALQESLVAEKQRGSIVTSYNRGLVKRSVSAKIDLTMLSAAASAEVSEPAEFIRVHLLGKEYTAELLKYLNVFGQGTAPVNKGPFTASRKSNIYGQKIYHIPGCKHIAKIKKENIIEFESEDEASKGGFSLCMDCARSLLRGQGK